MIWDALPQLPEGLKETFDILIEALDCAMEMEVAICIDVDYTDVYESEVGEGEWVESK